jgi:hypothetical protein
MKTIWVNCWISKIFYEFTQTQKFIVLKLEFIILKISSKLKQYLVVTQKKIKDISLKIKLEEK